jgi:hypothetical protein
MRNILKRILLANLLLLLITAQAAHPQNAHPSALNISRLQVLEDAQKAWSEGGAQLPYFEVIKLKSKEEAERIFPRGTNHLPPTLTPREIYPATGESEARRWQYLGTRTLRGFRFAIFRLVTADE